MQFDDLKNPELQAKLMSVKNADELVELAKAEGLDLTDEQLQALSGGSSWYCASVCPSNCGLDGV